MHNDPFFLLAHTFLIIKTQRLHCKNSVEPFLFFTSMTWYPPRFITSWEKKWYGLELECISHYYISVYLQWDYFLFCFLNQLCTIFHKNNQCSTVSMTFFTFTFLALLLAYLETYIHICLIKSRIYETFNYTCHITIAITFSKVYFVNVPVILILQADYHRILALGDSNF